MRIIAEAIGWIAIVTGVLVSFAVGQAIIRMAIECAGQCG